MSIVKSVRNSFAPIHREGYPFIGGFFIASIALGFIWYPLFWLGLVFTVWCIYFFRDPERVTPIAPDLITSPADGKISWVGPFVPPQELGLGEEEMTRISIFMDIFSVHVNRIPIDGKIREIIYRPGKFANAELDKASDNNERNGLVIETSFGNIGVVQVAGLVARRIVCWAKINDQVLAGQRFGLIRFGSRLDIYLPSHTSTMVSVGQKAIAGETILASFGLKSSMNDFRMD